MRCASSPASCSRDRCCSPWPTWALASRVAMRVHCVIGQGRRNYVCMATNATPIEKPTSPSPTSVRFDDQEHAMVESLRKALGCSSMADALRAVVRTTANPEVMQLVQEAAFVRLPELPRAQRYRVVAPFKKLVG